MHYVCYEGSYARTALEVKKIIIRALQQEQFQIHHVVIKLHQVSTDQEQVGARW